MIRGKKIWEQIRKRQLPANERKKLIDELAKLIKGNIKELVFKHDASRIVQTALKYGDKQTKENIALELKGTYVALAQSKGSFYLEICLDRLLLCEIWPLTFNIRIQAATESTW